MSPFINGRSFYPRVSGYTSGYGEPALEVYVHNL